MKKNYFLSYILKTNLKTKAFKVFDNAFPLISKRFIFFLAMFFFAIPTMIAQNTGDFRSVQTGNWTSLSTWEVFNGTSWVTPATFYPGQNTPVPPYATASVQILSGHTVTVATNLTTSTMGSVTVNGNLILSPPSPDNLINFNASTLNINGGNVNFSLTKTRFNLPNNAVITIESGGSLTATNCNNNQEIYIGSRKYAACVGAPGGIYTFNEVSDSGGNINASITIPSSGPVPQSCPTISLTGKYSGTISGPVNYIWYYFNPASVRINIPGGSGILPNTSQTTSVTFNASAVGTYVVFLEVSSGSFINTESRTFNISADTTAPTISCPTTGLNHNVDAGQCDYTGTFAATFSDNCSGVSVAYSIGSTPITFPYDFPVGSTTVTATATDAAGLQASCNFNVVVTDNIPPTILCPTAGLNHNVDAGQCDYTGTFAATFSDNCSGASVAYRIGATPITFPYDFPVGSTTVTATATDAAGLQASCNFNVVVTDNIPPTILCPTAGLNHNVDAGQCDYTGTFAATFSDNCSGGSVAYRIGATPITFPYDFPVGSTTVTATATDAAGLQASCNFNVVVTDNEKPTAICQDRTIQLDPSGNASITAAQINNSSYDNCGSVNLVSVAPNTFTCADIGTNNVVLTINDGNGNTETCNATVTITDASQDTSVNISLSTATTICANESVTFTANPSYSGAGGISYNYQWYLNSGSGYTAVGTNSSTYGPVAGLQNTDSVYVEVTSNLSACPVVSNTVIMTVNSTVTPEVDIKVTDDSVCAGQSVTFSTIASSTKNMGTNPSYQWYLNGNPTVTTPTYSGIFTNGDDVYLVMTPGPSVQCPFPAVATSSTIEMTVFALPTVTASASDIDICVGDSVNLSASGANTYSWDNGLGNGASKTISPTTTTTYTVTGTDTNGCVDTDSITITVNPLPTVTANATNMEICNGETVTLSATGASSYSWNNALGAGSSHDVTPSTTTTYTVTGTDGNGCIDTDSITITVNPLLSPSVSISASATEICSNNSITFTATPTNGGSSPSYQWFLNGNATGANSNSLVVSGQSADYNVYVVMTPSSEICVNAATAQSSTQNIDVYTTPATPGAINGPNAVCPPQNNIVYSVAADSNIQSYNWTFPTGFTVVSGGNSDTVTVNYNASGILNSNITVTATNVCGTSTASTLTVSTDSFLYVDAGPDQYICSGTTSVFLYGDIDGGVRRVNQWDWESVTPGGTIVNVNSLTSEYLLPAGVGPGDTVTIRIFSTINNTNNTCTGDVEDFMTIHILPDPTATLSGTTTICEGGTATLNFTGTPNTTVSFSDNNSNTYSANIDGSGNGTFTTGVLAVGSTTFTANTVGYTSGSACTQPASGQAVITVNQAATVTGVQNQTACEGIAVTLLGTYGGSATSGSWAIVGASGTGTLSGNQYTPSAADAASGTVTLEYITNDPDSSGPCGAASQQMTLTVNDAPEVSGVNDQSVCSDGSVSLTAVLGGSATSGTWSSNSGSPGVFTPNANSLNVTYTPSSNEISTGSATLVFTSNDPDGSEPCNVASDDMVLTIVPVPTISGVSDQTICSDESVNLNAILGGSISTGVWTSSSGYNAGFGNTSNPSTTYTPSNSDKANGSVVLTFTSNNATSPCGNINASMTLTIEEEIIITTQPQNVGVCANNPANISVVAAGDNLQYQWYFRSTPSDSWSTVGSNSNILNFPSAQISNNGQYYVEVSSTTGICTPEQTSSVVSLNVNQEIDIDVSDQPIDGTRCENDNYTFTVNAGGSINSWQWYKVSSPTDAAIGSAGTGSTATLNLTNLSENDEGDYYVVFTGPGGTCPSVSSLTGTLTITETPTVNLSYSSPLCSNDDSSILPTLSGTHDYTGGIYSSPDGLNIDASTGAFVPSANTPGNYKIDYTTPGNACAQITKTTNIVITPLPEVTISYDVTNYCNSDINSYTINKSGPNNGSYSVSPITGLNINLANGTITPSGSEAGTYTITYTISAFGNCPEVSESTTITIYALPVATFNYGANSFCINDSELLPSYTDGGVAGTFTADVAGLDLNASTGAINTSGSTPGTYTITNTIAASAGCDIVTHSETITISPLPQGGELSFGDPFGRVFLICENPSSGYAIDLNLSGQTGEVVRWIYKTSTATSWTTITDGSGNFTGTVLPASLIESLNITESIVIRAQISSGACASNTLSRSAIVSVIPSNIQPSPVTVSKDVICLGETVLLSSETGYGEDFGKFDGGDFDNSSITQHGWRITDENGATNYNFDSSADNTQPDKWLRTNPHNFITANLNDPYTTYSTRWDTSLSTEGNKGFAIVSGDNPSYLETPTFCLSGLDEAILTFDQAFNLTPGASIKVWLSTGTSGNGVFPYDDDYDVLLYEETGTATSGNYNRFGDVGSEPNHIEIDLGDYLGDCNLRIMFEFEGTRNGDVWTLDDIRVPEGPRDVALEWYDTTDPDIPIYIGNSNTEEWTPSKIGWNEFEVQTLLVLDSNGNTCGNINNSQTVRVFAFDQYTSTTSTDSNNGCGESEAQISAVVSGNALGTINSYPTVDGYIGQWDIQGPSGYTIANTDATSTLNPMNNPNINFEATDLGAYTFTWTLVPTELDDSNVLMTNVDCPPTQNSANLTLTNCSQLDFDGDDDLIDYKNDFDLNLNNFSIEVWIKPDATQNDGGTNNTYQTIISKRNGNTMPNGSGYDLRLQNGAISFNSDGGSVTTGANVIGTERWYHVAVTFGSGTYKLYIDGIEIATAAGAAPSANSLDCFVGAMDQNNNPPNKPVHYFSGWMEELRLWNVTLTEDQIHIMMNQEIENNGGNAIGSITGPLVETGLVWGDLLGYYQMNVIAKDRNPLNCDPNELTAGTDLSGGYLIDNSGNGRDGRPKNITTQQPESAPLPYIVNVASQNWETDTAWLNWDVQDPPNSTGINGARIDWNIAQSCYDITSSNRDLTLLGLVQLNGEITITDNSAAQNETSPGTGLWITHYLKLDGIMDLIGESQLVQKRYVSAQLSESILDVSSSGYLERDQQGTNNPFNYNYWGSPVGPIGAGSNNNPRNVNQIMRDGTNSSSPVNIQWTGSYTAPSTTPISLSNRWVYAYENYTANTYANWRYLGNGGNFNAGLGHIMKGSGKNFTAYTMGTQNYVFIGKPNNATITTPVNQNFNALVGNPYPSAIDANTFIDDNGPLGTNTISGALYFWEHYLGNTTHILKDYEGGYAVLNKTGGIAAATPPITADGYSIIGGAGTKVPERYIPVGQGFFVTAGDIDDTDSFVPTGGNIVFNNDQRVFQRENVTGLANEGSVFFKSVGSKAKNNTDNDPNRNTKRLRIDYKTSEGAIRQLLLGFLPGEATDNFDYGYDAPKFNTYPSDMTWIINNKGYEIQGVGDFEENKALPLGVYVSKLGNVEISLNDIIGMEPSTKVYVYDSLLGTYSKINNTPFNIILEPGDYLNRFYITFSKKDNSLSIEEDVLEQISVNYLQNSKEIHIRVDNNIIVKQVYLTNMLGQTVKTWNLSNTPSLSNDIKIPVNNIAEGSYIIKVQAAQGNTNKKIVIGQ